MGAADQNETRCLRARQQPLLRTRSPLMEPSFLPSGASSSMPIQSPVANCGNAACPQWRSAVAPRRQLYLRRPNETNGANLPSGRCTLPDLCRRGISRRRSRLMPARLEPTCNALRVRVAGGLSFDTPPAPELMAWRDLWQAAQCLWRLNTMMMPAQRCRCLPSVRPCVASAALVPVSNACVLASDTRLSYVSPSMGGCLRKPRSPPFVDCITEYARANPAQVKESWAIFEDVLQKKPTLNEEEFDTVFGLLCGDGERHFQVFVEDGLVDSYEALCAIVLCLRIQFKHKVDIILTYCGADARGYSHARSFVNMLRKCAGGMHRLVGLPMPDAVDFELVNVRAALAGRRAVTALMCVWGSCQAWFEKEGPLEEVIVGGDDVARWVADDRSVREYVERTEQIVVGIVGSAVDVGGTLLSGALMVAGRAGTTCVDHVAEAHSSDGIPLWDMPLTQLANRSWWETIPTWSDNTIVIKMLHVRNEQRPYC